MAKATTHQTDAEFLASTTNFSTLIASQYAAYGLSESQSASFDALLLAYSRAYQLSRDPDTRTVPNTTARRAARRALADDLRLLVSIVNGQANVTDAQWQSLGIHVRKSNGTPIPPPSSAPDVDVVSVVGRVVKVRLHGGAARRGRPAGVAGAGLFTFVGEVPPADPAAWRFEGITTRTLAEIEFAGASPEAAWVTASWFNPRGQTGAAADPVRVNLPAAGASGVTAATMRIAA